MWHLLAACKILALLIVTAILIIPQIFLILFKWDAYIQVMPQLWHKAAIKIFNIQVNVAGPVNHTPPTLYVCNHLSYFDISALGSIIQSSFVAKREVASWPIFGFLAKLQQTAFIDRNPVAAKREADNLAAMLAAGRSLVLFPEGTSTDGQDVKPFKSSLFALALPNDMQHPLMVQPVTIELSFYKNRDDYAWYGDMVMAPHLWAFAKTNGVTLTLHFHPTISANGQDDRKTLANQCWEAVRAPLCKPPSHILQAA